MKSEQQNKAAGSQDCGPAALLFDLGGVLITLDEEAFRAHWTRLGVPPDRLARFMESPRNLDWNLGRIPMEDFPRLLRRDLQLPGWPATRLREAWNSMLGEPNAALCRLAARAHACGMRVGLLSNTDPWHWEEALGRLPFKRFDPLGLSFLLAALKPDPAAFRNCLAAGDEEMDRLDPKLTLFIDDRQENLASAAALGFSTWHLAGKDDVIGLERHLDSVFVYLEDKG